MLYSRRQKRDDRSGRFKVQSFLMTFKRRGGINTMFHLTHNMLKTCKQQNKKCADRNGGGEGGRTRGFKKRLSFSFSLFANTVMLAALLSTFLPVLD